MDDDSSLRPPLGIVRQPTPREQDASEPSGGQRSESTDVVDVFVYVVVLNLAVEYVPSVISETFTLTLVAAVLLKLVLELVIVLKKSILDRVKTATTTVGTVASALLLWGLAIGITLLVSPVRS